MLIKMFDIKNRMYTIIRVFEGKSLSGNVTVFDEFMFPPSEEFVFIENV